MATSFVIADNSVIDAADFFSCTGSFTTQNPWQNILGGSKYILAKTATDTDEIQIDLHGKTAKPADYFIVGYCSAIVGASFDLLISSDGTSYSSVASGTIEITSSDEMLIEFSEVSAKYWRIVLTSASDQAWSFGQISLGKFLDLGCEPEDFTSEIKHNEVDFIADSGNAYFGLTTRPKLAVDVKWVGVSDALAVDFERRVVNKYLQKQFYLVARTYTKLLRGNTILKMHCTKATKQKVEAVTNWNLLDASFVEVAE